MATQASIPPLAPLFAATILTAVCALVPDADSSERAELLTVEAFKPTQDDANRRSSFEPDAVNQSRWAKPQPDYILRDSGRIVLAESSTEEIARATSPAPPTGRLLRDKESDIVSVFSHNASDRIVGCGLTPATPAAIARLVVEAALRHEVDVEFALAIATTESRLDRLRNSPKGARGPMQLMPETAERFGVTDICDPEENIDAGVRYLRELSDEFRNPLLVAAAYNAGEGRVREHGGIPPFKETLGYVAAVLNIQMGLEGSGPIAGEPSESADDLQRPSNVQGVITSRDRRQWVGGVMHF